MTKPFLPGEIRPLTGIRGAAAIYVMLYHFLIGHQIFDGSARFLRHGYMSVDLFFVLSGFVMCLSYGSLFARAPSWQSYGEFLGRRIARIYPLYVALLLFVLATLYAGLLPDAPPSAPRALANLLLIHTWVLSDSVIAPSWSVSTELAAYLLFPTLLLLTRHRNCWAAAGLAAGLIVLVATRSDAELHEMAGEVSWRNGPLDVAGSSFYPLLRCLGEFLLGMVAFRLVESGAVRSSRAWRLAANGTPVLILLLLCLPNTDLLLVPLFVVLVIALATQRSLAGRLLGWGPVHQLGAISYSIYLVHDPLSHLLEAPLISLFSALHLPHAYTLSLIATQLAVVPVSAATYVLVEKPGRDLVRRALSYRRHRLYAEPRAS